MGTSLGQSAARPTRDLSGMQLEETAPRGAFRRHPASSAQTEGTCVSWPNRETWPS
jgi:hypothetical protein